ncbi:MAG: glutamine--fructose-6-phosphate transaminase (isomerizing) [Actinomycetota bacterium]
MCGIIACQTDRSAVEFLRVGLRRLEYRGYDSVGIAVRGADGKVVRLRTTGRTTALDHLLDGWSDRRYSGAGIGHTRWATHGSVSEQNAHPHLDCTGEIGVVHNGIIENAGELRVELQSTGHVFSSDVDSEVLCHLIEEERLVGGDLAQAVQKALVRADGSWAIAVLDGASGRIVVAAQGSPLLVAHTDIGVFAASDIAAIADWTQEFRVLDDGDVVDLYAGGSWAGTGASASAPVLRRPWAGDAVDATGYADYMSKEIDEQPAMAERLLDAMADAIADGSLWHQTGLPAFERLQVLGCGTSLNAGSVIGNLVRSLGGMPVTTVVASEAAEEIPERNQLCLAMSQSGETADVLRALQARGSAQVLALTNNTYSTLARVSDATVGCCAGPEIGVAATKTFMAQVITGVALMISALVASSRLPAAEAVRLVDELRRLPDQLAAAYVQARRVVPRLVDELGTADGFVFIARGHSLPYAAEGALKLKELTYLWVEHCPAGELKHGPLALVTSGTPVVVVDNGESKLAGNIAEVSARGGQVITIGAGDSTIPIECTTAAPWGPIAATLPLQVLAHDLAAALGRDVDKPRNLAKSVTVE